MDISEIEENLLYIGEPKLHSQMCKSLCGVYVKVSTVFPDIEAARPRRTSGIRALCDMQIALDKTKNILQHCAECSKLYSAITGDSVVLKFEKARCALEDALNRVENIVPQAISVQIELHNCLNLLNTSINPPPYDIVFDVFGWIPAQDIYSTVLSVCLEWYQMIHTAQLTALLSRIKNHKKLN